MAARFVLPMKNKELFRQKISAVYYHQWFKKGPNGEKGEEYDVQRYGFAYYDDGNGIGKVAKPQLGPSHTTLENWNNGAECEQESVERMVEYINTKLYTPEALETRDFGDDVPYKDCCKVMGIDDDEVRASYSQWLLRAHGPDNDFLLDNAEVAEKVLKSYGGFHHIYRRENDGRIIRMGLAVLSSVRYLNSNRHRICARLSVPSRSRRGKPFFYAGMQGGHANVLMSYLFSQEAGADPDQAFLYLERGNTDTPDFERWGRMTTMTQARMKNVVDYEIVVRRALDAEFMYSDAQPFLIAAATDVAEDIADYDSIDKLLPPQRRLQTLQVDNP